MYFQPGTQKPPTVFRCIREERAAGLTAFSGPQGSVYGRVTQPMERVLTIFTSSDCVAMTGETFSIPTRPGQTLDEAEGELVSLYFQRFVLVSMLRESPDLRLLHAAALSHNGSGVLILAPSRGGKTTLALAANVAGMTLISDDHSLVNIRSGEILPFPRTIHMRKSAFDMVPEFAAYPPGREVYDGDGALRYDMCPEAVGVCPGDLPVRVTHVIKIEGFGAQPRLRPIAAAVAAVACTVADIVDFGKNSLDLLWAWGGALQGAVCAEITAGLR
jgi:hypothetical protein